jgi:hypothetical protein
MTPMDCEREDDVLAAVGTGRWPARVDEELRAHVAGCAVCKDVVAVTTAFREDLDTSEGGAASAAAPRLPDATRVWLRSQIRARAEDTRLAERPISVAQAVAFAAVVGVLGALFGAASPWLQSGFRWAMASLAHLDPRAFLMSDSVVAMVTDHVAIAVTAGVCVMLAPVAIYFALREN